jgi:Cft2 family RNA processing exonuclease
VQRLANRLERRNRSRCTRASVLRCSRLVTHPSRDHASGSAMLMARVQALSVQGVLDLPCPRLLDFSRSTEYVACACLDRPPTLPMTMQSHPSVGSPARCRIPLSNRPRRETVFVEASPRSTASKPARLKCPVRR